MKNLKVWKLILLAVMVMLAASACTSIGYKGIDLGGGDQADVVWKTSTFGTDAAAIRFKSKAPSDPDILRLQAYESRQVTTQTYDQKCPDPKQLKNIKTTTVNECKTSFKDVPNPNKRQDQSVVVGGTNPSTGNMAVPAVLNGTAAGATGGVFYYLGQKARRPARIGISQQGGNQTGGGATTAPVTATSTTGPQIQTQTQAQSEAQTQTNTQSQAQ